MKTVLSFDELVGNVLAEARDHSEKDDRVRHYTRFLPRFRRGPGPGYIDFLSHVESLQALVPALERRHNLVLPATPEKALWYFVRDAY